MARLVPRLSGSCWKQVEGELSCVESSIWGWFEELIDGAQVHDVCADESCEGEWAEGYLAGVLDEAQQQVGDQGAGDLDTDGVLRSADEVLDLQGLFDPAEEQLDGPAAFVEVGDLLGGGIQIVGDDAQGLAVVEGDANLADRVAEGVLAGGGQALGQQADAVVEQLRARWQGLLGGDGERGVLLQPGDDAAAGGVKIGPPGVVIVAQGEDVGGA